MAAEKETGVKDPAEIADDSNKLTTSEEEKDVSVEAGEALIEKTDSVDTEGGDAAEMKDEDETEVKQNEDLHEQDKNDSNATHSPNAESVEGGDSGKETNVDQQMDSESSKHDSNLGVSSETASEIVASEPAEAVDEASTMEPESSACVDSPSTSSADVLVGEGSDDTVVVDSVESDVEKSITIVDTVDSNEAEDEAEVISQDSSVPDTESEVIAKVQDSSVEQAAEETVPPKSTKKSAGAEKLAKAKKSPIKESTKQAKTPGKDSLKHSSKVAAKSKKEKGGNELEFIEKDEKVKRITPSDKTLWVSSLSNKTRAADLKSLFSKHGKVSSAKILTNSKTPGTRCYGLVTLVTSRDAMACIKNLHHTELHGRVISVEKTRLALKQPVSTTTIKTSVRVEEKGKKDVKSDNKKGNKEKTNADKKDVKEGQKACSEKPEGKQELENKADIKKDDLKGEKSLEGETKITSSERRSSSNSKISKERDSHSRTKSRDGNEKRGNRHSRSKSRSLGQRRFRRSPIRSRSPLFRQNRSKSPERRNRYGKLIVSPYRFKRSYDNFASRRFEGYRSRFDDCENDREMQRRNRQETMRLERERERLKNEREQLEREKARVLRIEKEQQRLEREKLEREMDDLRKYSMILNRSKGSLDREDAWDERKRSRLHHGDAQHAHSRSSDSDRRDRHSIMESHGSRYYDSSSRRSDRPYHGDSNVEDADRSAVWSNQVGQDHGKYAVPPTVPGIWARMDIPPTMPEQRWGSMEQPRVQQPGLMNHHHQPPGMNPLGNQVVMFVGDDPANNGSMPEQYPSSRFGSNTMRRF